MPMKIKRIVKIPFKLNFLSKYWPMKIANKSVIIIVKPIWVSRPR